MAERSARNWRCSGEPIPAAWEEAIAACLSKIPEERPATMAELAERLRLASPTRRLPALTPRPPAPVADQAQVTELRSAPPTLPHQPSRATPRWLVPAAAGAAALLVAVIAAIFLMPHHRAESVATLAPAPVPQVTPEAPKPELAETLRPVPDVAPTVPAQPPATPAPAELRVESEPAGAVVHIPGQPDQHTLYLFYVCRVMCFANYTKISSRICPRFLDAFAL